MKRLMRRTELARALGTTPPTVKYYTSLGLFPVEKKTDHGQYLYNYEAVKGRYVRILELKEKRLRIDEIKDRLRIEVLIQN
ncbi:MAG: MerR family transcriptional regulator [Candidatus Omnitrophota bacterium]|nr:MerR family transcriptional regulator [Candidatus Omnitrophota bacterium]